MRVKIPDTYADAMCGLCGNYNHNPNDDLKLKNGTEASSVEELGKSWRVAEIPGCVDGCKNESVCPDCDITEKDKYETDRYCGLLLKSTGPFRECHAKISPDAIFKNCVYEMCLYNAKEGSWCTHLRSYTLECQELGVIVSQWRTDEFCPISGMTHYNHSHYEHCGDVCHATCDPDFPPNDCKRPCQEAWICDHGYLLSNNECVPDDQCGCKYQNRNYEEGESFLLPDCLQRCTCYGNGNVSSISRT